MPVGTETVLRLVLWKCWYQNSNVVVKAKQAFLYEGERDDAAIVMHKGCSVRICGYLCGLVDVSVRHVVRVW